MKKLVYILLSLGLSGCIESFDFETPRSESLLVVDGLITNELKNHTITLVSTSSLDVEQTSPVTGAEVRVFGPEITYTFEEVSAGNYQSNQTFRGESGQSYRLSIQLGDKQYESEWTTMPNQAEIGEVYEELVEKIDVQTGLNGRGIQFFLNADSLNGAKNFRYKWIETWEVRVPYPSTYDWDFDREEIIIRQDQIGVCFDSDTSSTLLVSSAEAERVSEFPIRFLTVDKEQLRFTYSLLIEQYSITDQAITYYNTLRRNNESGGSLFDQQQGAVLGNVTNVEDPDEIVLGYFEVSAVSRKRVFAEGDDLRLKYNRSYPPATFRFFCPERVIEFVPVAEISRFLRDNPSRFIYRLQLFPDPPPYGYFVSPAICSDCTTYADSQKPDYWID